MTESQRQDLASDIKEIIIEEDNALVRPEMPWRLRCAPEGGDFCLPIKTVDRNSGRPVPNVEVFAMGAEISYKAMTDEDGHAQLRTYEPSLSQVVISPRDTYWSQVVSDVVVDEDSSLTVHLRQLSLTGAYDWGSRLMGFDQLPNLRTDRPVRIAVIDSGVAECENLVLAGGYNALGGDDAEGWNADEEGYGTHAASLIKVNDNKKQLIGMAPNADIFSVKVWPGGHVSDLVAGVEWCIRNRMDVIDIGVTMNGDSHVLWSALTDANDRGITVVAAAGDCATHVAHPAALPSVIAVSAIGRFGTFPDDSAQALLVGRYRDARGELFSANFSNFGPQVDVCAPGIAVLSSVQTGLASRDGTFAACASISALVARIIESTPIIRTADASQPDNVRYVLQASAANIGMPAEIQGAGLPTVPRAIAIARTQLRSYMPS